MIDGGFNEFFWRAEGMPVTDLLFSRWHQATASAGNGDCVEVGDAPGLVGIRDTKNRDGGTLVVGRTAFDAFLSQVKAERLR